MLPEHLKIGYEVYRVSIGTKDFELQGECDTEHATIILTPNAGPRRRIATLIHEILHACWDQAEMGDIGDDAREEQIVNRLSTVLAQTLMDNPQLLRTLEQAGRADNGTCYRWREQSVTLPVPNAFAEAVERMVKADHEALERETNEPLMQRGNEQRSEQPCMICPKSDAKTYPECDCFL